MCPKLDILRVQEVVIGVEHVYLVLPASSGDLHSYVRSRRRLREASARQLFRQVVVLHKYNSTFAIQISVHDMLTFLCIYLYDLCIIHQSY